MLEENSVNSICTKNTNILRNDEKGSYTLNSVPQEYYNTKRHFFGNPNIAKLETFNKNNNNNNKKNENNLNLDLNIEQYIENLNNAEIKDPYYFNNKFIPNKNNNNKLIQLEVNENDILNILEKFNKIAKKMGFEIENSLVSCFKDKRNSTITNEMISFYLKVRYELDAIELQKILIYHSDNSEDPNSEFKLDEFLDLIRKFAEDKMKSTKKTNPFENNIYNMNDSGINFNSRVRSKSPQNKSMYKDESYRLGKNIFIYLSIFINIYLYLILFYFIFLEKNSNEWVFKVSSYIEKNNINLYRVFMEYDDDFDGKLIFIYLLFT
jgi:hypothetical protein